MATNIKQFNESLNMASKRFHSEDVPKFIVMVSLEVFRRIILRTPVDTGRARGNWQIEIDRPASGVIEITGTESRMTEEAINREVGKLRNLSPETVVHITNNVDYVYYLEYDKRSKQHPEGMVEITLQEMRSWVSRI